MPDTITIERRYNGPPESGHGGYVCGLLAAYLDAPAVEVTLRLPPPLDRALRVVRVDGAVELRDGDALVAGAARTPLDIEPPAPVPFEEASAIEGRHEMFDNHIYPSCYACGPDRAPGDGLRIFPGRVAGSHVVAAPWTPGPALVDGEGFVRDEFVWAALDCPNAFACNVDGDRPALLGRLAARIDGRVRAGEPCVIVARPLGEDGRKMYAASALFAGGALRACARTTWISLRR